MNWKGAIKVPAVVQNAHNVAYLAGESLEENSQVCESLKTLPYYLWKKIEKNEARWVH